MTSIIELLKSAVSGTEFRTKAGITLVYQGRMDESYAFPHIMYDRTTHHYVGYSTQGQLCNGWRGYPAYELTITDKENEMKNETKIKSKQKYDEAEVRKLLEDKDLRLKTPEGCVFSVEHWAADTWLLTSEEFSFTDSANFGDICNPKKFTFFKEVSRLEPVNLNLIPDEPSIQEIVANSKVGDLFETEGNTELELVEINHNSKYARYVFKGTRKLFGDNPPTNSFSADLQTANNRPIQNPSWKIVRKL